MKIMLALDGSRGSDAVVGEVGSRRWPEGAECCLVTAVDPFFFTKAPLLLEEAKKAARLALDENAESLKKTGMKFCTEIVLENPRSGLAKAATEWKADLVLTGSHGRGAFGRLLMGSTAQAVLRRANCSVEIVRESNRKRSEKALGAIRVLVPTDGSECANAAVQSVASRPWTEETEFRVMSCPEMPVITGVYPYYTPEVMLELSTASEEHAKDAVKKGVEILKKAGLRVSSEVTEPKESAVRGVLGVADLWSADLIVMGSHGRTGFDRYVLGSVSEAVALHASCSVEVVRAATPKK